MTDWMLMDVPTRLKQVIGVAVSSLDVPGGTTVTCFRNTPKERAHAVVLCATLHKICSKEPPRLNVEDGVIGRVGLH